MAVMDDTATDGATAVADPNEELEVAGFPEQPADAQGTDASAPVDQVSPPSEATPAAPVEAPAPPAWYEKAGFQSEEAAWQAWGKLNLRAQQAEQWAQHLAQERAQQAQAAEAAKPAKPSWHEQVWNPPKLNQALVQQYTDPETGKLRPEAPPGLRQQVDEYLAYQSDFKQRFNENPYKLFWDAYQEPLKEMLDQRFNELYQQNFGQYQSELDARTWVQQNADYLFAKDAQGNYIPDPYQPGKYLPTPQGATYLRKLQAIERGEVDPRVIARVLADLEHGQAASPEAVKQTFLAQASERGRPLPASRAGTLAADEGANGTPQNDSVSFFDRMLASAKATGEL